MEPSGRGRCVATLMTQQTAVLPTIAKATSLADWSDLGWWDAAPSIASAAVPPNQEGGVAEPFPGLFDVRTRCVIGILAGSARWQHIIQRERGTDQSAEITTSRTTLEEIAVAGWG